MRRKNKEKGTGEGAKKDEDTVRRGSIDWEGTSGGEGVKRRGGHRTPHLLYYPLSFQPCISLRKILVKRRKRREGEKEKGR